LTSALIRVRGNIKFVGLKKAVDASSNVLISLLRHITNY